MIQFMLDNSIIIVALTLLLLYLLSIYHVYFQVNKNVPEGDRLLEAYVKVMRGRSGRLHNR